MSIVFISFIDVLSIQKMVVKPTLLRPWNLSFRRVIQSGCISPPH